MNNVTKRLIGLVLAVLMLVSSLPLGIFADDVVIPDDIKQALRTLALAKTTQDKINAIVAAEPVVVALTEEQKAYLVEMNDSGYKVYLQLVGKAADLEAIMPVETALEPIVKIKTAQEMVTFLESVKPQVDALTDVQKELIASNKYYKTYDVKMKSIEDLKLIIPVEDSLNALNDASTKDEIKAVRATLTALTPAQYNLIAKASLKILEDLEVKLVKAAIDALTTENTKEEIEAVRAEYNALTEAQRGQVDNIAKLDELQAGFKDEDAKKKVEDLKAVYDATEAKLLEVTAPKVGTDDLLVFALARAGKLTDAQKQSYIASVEEKVEANKGPKLSADTSVDNSMAILALTAIGYDVTNVKGYNLLKAYDNINYTGIDPAYVKDGSYIVDDPKAEKPVKTFNIDVVTKALYAMMAIKSYDDYSKQLPDAENKLESVKMAKLKNVVVNSQSLTPSADTDKDGKIDYVSDGGWIVTAPAADGTAAQADITFTAKALTALVASNNGNDDTVIHRALDSISLNWKKNEKFMTAEEAAYSLLAMVTAGINPDTGDLIDPTKPYFTDDANVDIVSYGFNDLNGRDVLDDIIELATDGAYAADAAGQAVYLALTAYYNFVGKDSIYLMNDCKAAIDASRKLGEADRAAAKAVDDLIAALGNKPAADKVAEARKAYDALTDIQKRMVEKYDLLLKAENPDANTDNKGEENKDPTTSTKKPTTTTTKKPTTTTTTKKPTTTTTNRVTAAQTDDSMIYYVTMMSLSALAFVFTLRTKEQEN